MTNSSRLSALCDKIIEASWLAAVVLTPLFFNIYSSRVFEPDKLTLLRSIALIMIAAWIVRTIEERAALGKGGHAEPGNGNRALFNGVTWRTPLILPTLVLVIVYLIATVLSVAPHTSFFGSYQRLQGAYTTFSYIVVFLMIVLNMRRRRQLDRLITAVVMTSMPIAFYGVLQRVDRDPLPWGGDVTVRVAGNMGNAIFIAAYLIMAFFLTLGRVIEAFRTILTEEESRVSDILRASAYIFVGAVQLITFAFAGSRGPLLGWLPGMFILGLVGLLMLRVTLHSSAAGRPAGSASGDASYTGGSGHRLSEIDILKALLLSLTSLAAAGIAFLLALSAFPGRPQVELAAVAALIGGLAPLLVFAGIQRASARWLWASWIFFSIVGAVALFEVNFSDHPKMVELRASGAFGSLGTLFESEGGTGKVRTLIWEGAVQLVRAHAPITYPDGTSDPLNFVRPIIGYGPESMYVAYNRFYPPDLAHFEARNASPDRSHNETWDSLVITGFLGFLAEQFLFLSVFFFALKFIGWAPNRRAAITLIAMMIGFGALGALGLGLVKGVNFMGTGWPGGVTAGIVLYVITFALFHFQIGKRVYLALAAVLIFIIDAAIFGATFTSQNRLSEMIAATGASIVAFAILYWIGRRAFDATAGQPIALSGHIFLIIALFGGMLAHYLEISLAGIAIAATRTYFWTFAGLLVVTGLNWVPTDDAEPAPTLAARPAPASAAPGRTSPANVPRHKKRKASAPVMARPEPRPSITRAQANWLGPTVAAALIGTLILITLGFSFINTPPVADPQAMPQTATQVIWNSLTRLPYKGNVESPGTLLMFLVTWVFGAVVSLTELRRRGILTPANQLQATLTYLGLSITAAFGYWMIHAGRTLDALDFLLKINTTQATSLNEYVNRFVTLAETMAGLLGLFYLAVIVTIGFIGLSLLSEARTRTLAAASEWGLIAALPAFAAALVLLINTNFNPIRADIIFKQGQQYVANNACDGAGDPLSQCDLALAHLKQALKYAPGEDFYMLALGASYLNKSAAAPDASALLVDNSTYASIINLDVQTTAQLNRRDALTAARVTLDHAQQINPLNTDHSANLARLHRRWSDLAADDAERKLRLEQAGAYYQQATGLSPQNAQLWNEWAVVFFSLYDLASRLNDTAAAQAALQEAQAKLDESLRLDQQFSDTYLYLSSLYSVRGQTAEAEAALSKALELSPDSPDAWGRLTEQLLATGNFTEAERITLDFVNRNPGFLPAWRMLSRRIYFPQGRLAEAIDAAQRSVELGVNDPGLWEDQLALAEMLRLGGDLAAALPYAQAALEGAPPDRKADAQQVLDAIQNALGGSSQPSSP
ncbi:MAG TPA: tetratricopeptide repeat protein [Anaerolineae bacterium]|nr:tetratricopeptide repeat protein [Anaerolineae bacterium]